MDRILYLIVGVLLGVVGYGLSVQVVAKLKPEVSLSEISQAFNQRDQVLANLINKIKEMESSNDGKSKSKAN